MSVLVEATLRWMACVAAYLALAGSLAPAELVAGALAGAGAAAFSLALRAWSERGIRLPRPSPRVGLRFAASVPRDIARLVPALARAQGGRMRRLALAPGEDPAAVGRRALAALLASVAPNGFVVAIRARQVVMHNLAGDTRPHDPEWLV